MRTSQSCPVAPPGMPSLTHSTLATVIQHAISIHSTLLGRAAHAVITKSILPPFPSSLFNHLINMYSKLDLPSPASRLLALTPASSRSVVTWTSLIAGSVQNARFAAALSHFSAMRRHDLIQPNHFTFPCVFKASGWLGLPSIGKQLHGLAIKSGQISSVFVGCGAFDMYSKTGFLDDAHKVFDEMPERNIVVWNAYISNSVLHHRPQDGVAAFLESRRLGVDTDSGTLCAFLNACSLACALQLGQQAHAFVFHSGFQADVRVGNGLIDFYGKCGEIESSERVFDQTWVRDDVTWSSMLASYVQNDLLEKASTVFLRAQKTGIELSDFIVSSVLTASAGLAMIELGRSVHALALKACLDEDLYVGSALVDMYGKCGSIDDSEGAFFGMPHRNVVTWNVMINGYAHLGLADMALALFEEMTCGGYGLLPNCVTLVCVLSACSRAGLVKLGMEIFESMGERYGMEPRVEHYACVVDMLGRAGMVERAYEFIIKMPIQPSVSVWGALLGACRVHGMLELGRVAADKIFLLDPGDCGNHVLLSNVLAASGRWEEADLVRKEMVDVGIKKAAGNSWITVKNTVHIFQAKDPNHSRSAEIQAMLAKVKMEMKGHGYVPDTSVALFDVEDEDKERDVWHHSEKLAVAFGLLNIPRGVPIRITKNLRICVDCHSVMKFISGIFCREIIVRDNHRFHRFKDNLCSCGDYW